MKTFVKLDQTMTDSSVWAEDHETFRIWIYLLTRVQPDGIVDISPLGAARTCNVSLAKMEEAIKKFTSPDKHSRSKALEGRRMVHIEDGKYRLTTYLERRNSADYLEKKAKSAERVREWRAANKKVASGDCNAVKRVTLRASSSSPSISSSDLDLLPDQITPSQVTPSRVLARDTMSHIPPDWEPDDATLGALAMAGVTEEQARQEAPLFVAHCQSEGTTRADWGAAFRKWCLRARNWAQERSLKEERGSGRADSKRSQRGITGQTQTEGSIAAAHHSFVRAKVNTHLKMYYGEPYPDDIAEQITFHSERLRDLGWDAEGDPPGLPPIPPYVPPQRGR